jgi:hypothetical protein
MRAASGQRDEMKRFTASPLLLRISFMELKYVFLSDGKHCDAMRKRSVKTDTQLQHVCKMKSSRCRILKLKLFWCGLDLREECHF